MRKAIGVSSVLLGGAAVGVLLRGVALNAGFFHDDAYITLRYAQNFLAGNGIGWNPGDRVEGYTNFLQLLVVSGIGALGVDLVAATRGVAFASYAALLVFLAGWLGRGRELAAGPRSLLLRSLPLAGVASSLPMLAWGFGGLEAPLLALLCTVGIALLHDFLNERRGPLNERRGPLNERRGPLNERRSPLNERRSPVVALASGTALALACMTRPDAGLFVAAGAAWLLLRGGHPRRWRDVGVFSLPLVVLLAPWLLWKLAYYGDVVPNTFYVKASDPSWQRLGAGLRYLGMYVVAPPFGLLLLVAGAARAAVTRGLRPGQSFAGVCLLLHLAWVLYVGGDQMPMHRLLVPVIPTALWLCFDLWLPDLRRLSDLGLAATVAALAVCLGLQLASGTTGGRNLNSTAFVGAAVGRHIGAAWPPGSLVALNTAGSTPYYAPGLRYLDMLGLNDAHIARRDTSTIRIRGQLLPGHAKGDGAYVLAERPDYIILGPANGGPASQPWFLSDLEISEIPAFRRDYELRQARLDVRSTPGWERYPESRSGEILLTWYQRRSNVR